MPTTTSVARFARYRLEVAEKLGLMVIAITIIVAGYREFMVMVGSGKVTLADPLVMFLEVVTLDAWRMLCVAASILLIAEVVQRIRLGHVRYPYREGEVRKASHLPNFGKV